MLSVGKLFAIAAIVALVLGLARWPTFGTGFYAITIKNRLYGFGPDYWAFSVGAIFALFAASYYWFPIFFSRSMNSRISLLHFWLSALAAFAFLLLAPVIHALTSPRDTAVSNDRAMTIVLAIAVISAILFLVAQIVFMASFLWSAFSGKTIGR
jgi:cytochrome c oxidase subunit 1